METFAVYWEPVIKTYGIIERTGLCLVSLDLPGPICDGKDFLSHIVSRLGGSLILIFSRPASPSLLCLNLLMDRSAESVESTEKVPQAHPLQLSDLGQAVADGICPGLRVDNPVELLYFQGPHYGDRYGIAAAAVTALAKHSVPLLGVVCTGASVYLMTPEGMASPARNALLEAFSLPETVSRPSNS